MANLSQNDRNIIAEHPLDKCLDHLQDPLRKAEQQYRPGSLSHDVTVSSQDQGPQKAISRVLYTLQGHEVALDLRSKIGNSNIATELSKLFGLVQSGRYNYEHYRALSRLVVTILAHRVVEHSETKWGISRLRAGHESSGIIHLLPVHRCICVAVRIEGSWRLLAM